MTATAIVVPSGVDEQMFERMIQPARKLSGPAGSIAGGYIGNAIYDGTHDQFIAVLQSVAMVLSYLRPYL